MLGSNFFCRSPSLAVITGLEDSSDEDGDRRAAAAAARKPKTSGNQAQKSKVYDVDEDTLWECLRVLARMVRDKTIDADKALEAEAKRSRPRSAGDQLFEAAMRDFERDSIR